MITRRANIEMATSSKADSPGGVDQVTKSRICRESFTKLREILVEKISELNKHDDNAALRMYFGVPNDDHLLDDVLDAAIVCQIGRIKRKNTFSAL